MEQNIKTSHNPLLEYIREKARNILTCSLASPPRVQSRQKPENKNKPNEKLYNITNKQVIECTINWHKIINTIGHVYKDVINGIKESIINVLPNSNSRISFT